MKTLHSFSHNEATYEISISNRVLKIMRYMETSGISRELRLDEVPSVVRERIIEFLEKDEV